MTSHTRRVRAGDTMLYPPTGRTNTVEVVAVDEAGRGSEPVRLAVFP